MLRGDTLEKSNIISVFIDTFETQMDNNAHASTKGMGQPRNDCVPYQSMHPHHQTKQCILRREDHNALPNFIGGKFPREKGPDSHELYCASMLVLLKPWRQLSTDLKDTDETWEDAFRRFKTVASAKELNILSSIQYFYECKRATQENMDNRSPGPISKSVGMEEDILEPGQIGHGQGRKLPQTSDGISLREEAHAHIAVEKAKQCKVFIEEETSWDVTNGVKPRLGSSTDQTLLEKWRVQMADDVLSHNQAVDTCNIPERMSSRQGVDLGAETLSHKSGARVVALNQPQMIAYGRHEPQSKFTEQTLTAIESTMLKADQYCTYDIVTWHLDKVLSGERPPPLWQVIHGEGGTGKSKVIQTVTKHFVAHRARYMLIKSAYTGIAASIIEGKTTHTITMISRHNQSRPLSDESRWKLQGYTYLIINEISMISKSFFAQLSRFISIAKTTTGIDTPTDLFGGINVIICGDFHQVPPVATPPPMRPCIRKNQFAI